MRSSDQSAAPYTWAVVVIILIGAVFVLGVLYLRPQVDPITLLSGVGGVMILLIGQAVNFIKSHQTSLVMNGQLHEFKQTLEEKSAVEVTAAKAEGKLEGGEQAREDAKPAVKPETKP